MTTDKKNPRALLTLAAAIGLTLSLAAAVTAMAMATEDDLRRHVEYLTSDDLEGRLTGTGGERLAADYLAAELEKLGAQPLPGVEGFQVPFEFTAGSSDAGTILTVTAENGEDEWTGTDSVQALSFSDSAEVSGPLVFAGYGLVVPESQNYPYDSYATLDVEDKVVLVLRYFPEDVDQETRGILSRYSGLRYKAMQARERGAKALIVVSGPGSPNAGEVVPMSFDTAIAGSGIAAASVSGAVAERIFTHVADKTLAQAQKAFDDGNPHVVGYEIPGVEVTLDVKVEREKQIGHNVVAMLPASGSVGGNGDGDGDGDGDGVDKPWVVFGAHYDHLGRGGGGNSLAKKQEAGGIHHGADDNASGVAAVLEAGKRLAAQERRRNVVLAFWSGEELGVLGSANFLKDPPMAAEEMSAYVNLDMVGRMRDNKLTLQAVGSSSVWPQLIERTNVPVGFDISTGEDPYLPTDSTPFNQASVPTIHFFTGSHEDYHRPSDTADKINYEDLERITRFGALMVGKLANLEEAPDFIKVEPKTEQGGGRDTVRAFTGTIPDYSTEVEGLLLSGVIGGGPADEAGLREGDVIVEFAGQTIANIYDYTYALDAIKVGEPVKVVFLRDGERQEVTITPRARD